MRGRNIAYFVLGATLAASGLYGIAISDMLSFQAGTPIKSAEVNQNFSTLKSAVQALEAPIGVSRLAVSGTAADGKVLKFSGGALSWADDIAGSSSNTYSADDTSLALSGTTFSVKDGGVGTTKLANSAVTASKIALPLSLTNTSPKVLSVTNFFDGVGVYGQSGSVERSTPTAAGVMGYSLDNIGVYGYTRHKVGVFGGSNDDGIGVQGRAVNGIAVDAFSSGSTGVFAKSQNGIGMRGESTFSDAIVGESFSSAHAGIVGSNQRGGFAAYFEAGSAVCSFKSGTTGWTCSSDKNLKEDFKPINPSHILDAVAKMPITTWSMKGSKVRQLGPTAQDFKAAFNLGLDDTSINATDAQGVALAAIQGLYRQNQEHLAKVKTLEAKVGNLEAQLAAFQKLEERLKRLENQQ